MQVLKYLHYLINIELPYLRHIYMLYIDRKNKHLKGHDVRIRIISKFDRCKYYVL